MPDTASYKGVCRDCGDEWRERSTPVICPECHSLNVVCEPVEEEDES